MSKIKYLNVNSASGRDTAHGVIQNSVVKQLVFAVVGPAGSGTSWVASVLREQVSVAIEGVDARVLKASDAIANWASQKGRVIPTDSKLDRAIALQDLGDSIRERDVAGVAVRLMAEMQKAKSCTERDDEPFRVFILDSIKHPAEVAILRSVYQDAFCLIGVVCDSDRCRQRLQNEKCADSSRIAIHEFISRDQDSGIAHGQKVADAFHLADFFIDNTPDRFLDDERTRENPDWNVTEQLGRLLDVLTHSKVVRPRPNETGMFHAYGAQMRSACLSRQVGAALMDKKGDIVATGTNEVPRAGGGIYGTTFHADPGSVHDARCAFGNKYCSNNREQSRIVGELRDALPELGKIELSAIAARLKTTTIGRLLEFSRAVHAEMDALLTAARQGISPVGCRLFVTTFPCHYCARHIVTAGVDEVQYIEPYPKSKALTLHGDAIVQTNKDWNAPSEAVDDRAQRQALFRPFTGVAPRLYRRAFMKDRSLKNEGGELQFGEPKWASGLLNLSYAELEKRLIAESEKL